jgi:hypothetical protein
MREELKGGLSNNYSVLLKPRKLPLSLVNYDRKVKLSYSCSFGELKV